MSYKATCHDVGIVKQRNHNEHYLKEDILVDEHKLLLNRAINVLGLFISNVSGIGDCQMLAMFEVCFGLDKCDERDKSRYSIKLK